MINAIVVEDSRLARDGLVRMLGKFEQVNVVATAESVADALQAIEQYQPQLLFLDIHMPEENGFDLLGQVSYPVKVIFTTAYAEYAVQSFDYNTVDYLLKPISQARLAKAIDKLCADDTDSPTAAQQAPASSPEAPLDKESKIFIKDGEQCFLLTLNEIELIESCKNYVRVFFDGKNSFIKKSLSQVESRLPNRLFFRANRQVIINLHYVEDISQTLSDGYEVKLQSGRLIEVSRRNVNRMKELLSL